MTPGGSPADRDGAAAGHLASRHDDLTLALRAAGRAGELVLRWFREDPEVRHKSPDQPVTEADLRADAQLKRDLLAERPGYGWLSEETRDDPERLERRRVWIVDPVDGTRSFIAGLAEFSISIALVDQGQPVLGVVHNPAARHVVWAVKGAGAFQSTDWDGRTELVGGTAAGGVSPDELRIQAPPTDEPPTVLASRTEIARGDFQQFRPEWTVRPLGSTAWKLAGVAFGLGHGYISRGPKSEWDIAAGTLVVQEAGGVATDLNGRGMVYNRPDPRVEGVVAAAPAVHESLLELAERLRRME